MKKLLAIMAFLCLSVTTFSQALLDTKKGYRLPREGNAILVYPKDPNNNQPMARYKTLDYNYYFILVSPLDYVDTRTNITYVAFKIPNPLKRGRTDFATAQRYTDGNAMDSNDFDVIYYMRKTDFDSAETEYYRWKNDVIFGATTMPFKIRPKRGNESSSILNADFNLGVTVGWGVRLFPIRNYKLLILGSFGINSITYNSTNNTEGIVDKEKSEIGIGYQYSGGIVFDFNGTQVGAMVGADHGFGDLSLTYKYQDAMWFSLAIAVTVFKSSDAKGK